MLKNPQYFQSGICKTSSQIPDFNFITMVDINSFKQIALSFPDVKEEPHFEKTSFRIKKKIFATVSVADNKAVLKLSELDQSVFCSFDKSIIYPVNGAWGKQGWTIVELKTVRKDMLKDLLTTSYCNVAPKTLSKKLQNK